MTPQRCLWWIFAGQTLALAVMVFFYFRLVPVCGRTAQLDRRLEEKMPSIIQRYSTEDPARLRQDALQLLNNSASAGGYVEEMEKDGLNSFRSAAVVFAAFTAATGMVAYRLSKGSRTN